MTDTLISRLEQAEAGSRELDLDLWWELKACRGSANEPMPEDYRASNLRMDDAPRYTTSIDAAMSLVPEGWDYCITPRNGVWVRQSEHFPTIHGSAATPALALCIAALKAKP